MGGGGVQRPRCLRLSASLNQHQRRFSGETGDGGVHVGSGNCVSGLYSHMGPLGLKVLHAGQNLLLVTGQGHAHLSQFTRGENHKHQEWISEGGVGEGVGFCST